MSYKINWTSEAEITFANNLEYLSKEWDTRIAIQFLDRVDEVLENIKSNPRLFPIYRAHDNVYKCVVHERIILYYKVVDDNTIDLLTFWNTYREPSKLKL